MTRKKINDWAFQWKMNFNPDRSKQTQEVRFSRKIWFSTITMLPKLKSQKYLGVILDGKLTFEEDLKNKFNKTNKTTRLLRKLSNSLKKLLKL